MATGERVGFAGLGIMGSRMALQLVRQTFAVSVWNRTRERTEPLVQEGAEAVNSPAELARRVDVVCLCLSGPRALRAVVRGPQGLWEGIRKGQLIVDFSTSSPRLAHDFATEAMERGADWVEAPVTGSKSAAETASLLVMAGGSDAALARAAPILAAVGHKTIPCGQVGSASQVKLTGNALIACMLQGLCEGLLLAQKAGVPPEKVLEVVQASGFRSPYFDFKGPALLRRDFSTHFAIDLMFKDLTLFLKSAAELRVPTPLVAAVREVYQLARSQGKGELDISAVITALEDLCGVRLGQGRGAAGGG